MTVSDDPKTYELLPQNMKAVESHGPIYKPLIGHLEGVHG